MQSGINKIIAILCLFLLLVTLGASAENYVKLSQFNTEDGLKQNTITQIMQDNEGYLWIGTSEGLNRYDGHRITTLFSPDKILESNFTELVWQDSTGLIWIGAADSNNYVLDKKHGQLTLVTLNEPLDYESELPVLVKMVEDANHDLWMATYRELYFFDRSTNKYEFVLSLLEFFPDKEQAIRDLLLLDNLLLIATSKGLYSLDLKTNQISLIKHTNIAPENIDQNNVKKLHLTKDGRLLIGTVEGLYKIDIDQIEQASNEYLAELIIAELNIWQLIEKQDYFWVATNKGLFKLEENNELIFVFKFSETPFNTSDDDINLMIEDREGSLWFGSTSDGLFKWHPNAAIKKHLWKKGINDSRLNDDMIYDIYQSSKDTIWFGTNNGLTKLDQKTGKTVNLLVDSDEKQVVSGSSIYSIGSHKGKLWLNTFDGIQIYDEKTFKKEEVIFPKTDNNIFSKNSVNHFHFFSDDNVGIITQDGMYDYSISENKVSLIESTVSHGDKELALYALYDVGLGNNEFLIGGTDRLWVYSKDSNLLEIFHQLPKDQKYNTWVNDVYRDDANLWVTYPGYGIFILDAKSGKELHFISEESINANSVMDIFPDKNGNVWLSSNDGLLRINKSSYHVTKFDSKDGLVTSEFVGGTKLVLDTGEVYLGTVKGALRINPNEMGSQQSMVLPPQISNVSLLSKKIDRQYSNFDNATIELFYDDFGLKVEFSALLLDKPNQVKYQYWIEGDNSIEKTVVKGSELFFPSFNPGTSQLFISAIGYNKGIESPPVSLTIISHPAPWFSTLAISLYIIIFILIASSSFIILRKRIKAKEAIHQRIKQNEERLNLALKGGNSGLWDWHSKDNMVYEPRLDDGVSHNEDKIVSFKERLSAIHFRDQNEVLSTWRDFLRGDGNVFDVTYRMLNSDAQMRWYRDVAMVSEYDSSQNPIRVTGTYTDITEKQEATKQVGLFSKAFENTRDIIIILDHDKKVIAVNKAFQSVSGYNSKTVMNSGLEYFILSPSNKNLVTEIFTTIDNDEHWKGEAIILKENANKIPVLINATTFVGNDSNQYFVFSLSDIHKQKEAEQALKKRVNYDELTGLPNRTLLLDRISHAIKHSNRYDKQIAIFFIDLDRFKQINDTLGHDAGDLLLTKSAEMFRAAIRDDDTVARIGGDEFVAMLEDIDDVESIDRVAQNILRKMGTPVALNDNQVTVSASIGISIYPKDANNASELLKLADIAMYHAKSAGRNNYQYFHKGLKANAKYGLKKQGKDSEKQETEVNSKTQG